MSVLHTAVNSYQPYFDYLVGAWYNHPKKLGFIRNAGTLFN